MNNENTKLIAIDGSPTTTSEYQNILIRNYDSTEFSNVHNNSPLNDLTEEYVLFASDVMDYIDKDNYLVATSKSMSPRAKTTAEPQLSIAPSVSRKDDAGQQFLQTFEDPESTQGSSEMNEIELVLLPSNQEEKIKIEPTYKPLPSSAPRLQSAESVVRTQLPNAIQNRVTKNAPPTAVMNNVSVNPPSMRNQPVILTTTKKLMSEVTQTTAKVSIGNTTISVPLLKPINSSQIHTTGLFPEAQKAQQPMTKLQKSPQQKQQLNIKKILNVKRPGPKANQPTIVSLSQLQVKPMSTAKIVQAKVVGKKMQIQLPNNSTVTSPSPTTSASGLVTITASRPKPNILQNVSFIKSPTKKDVMPNVPDESVGNVSAVSSNVPDQILNSTDNVTPATTNITSPKIKNIKDSQAEHKTALPPVKKTDVTAAPSSNTSSLRNLKTTSLNPTCTSTVKKILASASMHNNPPLLMPLCKPTENHQVQALVNAKRSAIGSTVSIIKQTPNSQLITISGGSNNAASVSVSSCDLRPQQTSTDSLSLKSQPVMLGSSENISKIPGTSLISMPRNISVLLTKSDSNQQIKTSFVNTSASSVTTHSASQTEQLSKKLNLCRSGSFNITTVTLPQSLAGTISPIVTSKATETMTMKAPIVSLAVPVSQSIVQTVESNAGSISVAPKQMKVPSSTASLSLFGVPSVKRPRMSEAENDSEEIMQAAQSQAKRPNLDVNNSKGLEANASESTPEANNRIVKDTTSSNEKSAEVKHQIMPQPSLTIRQEDTHNVLLKQLLQNTSNSVTVAKSPSPPVCSQVLSARKVINVRAPSLGLVSSLEAQLARPVLPPVPTATTSQIAVDTSSSPKNSVSKNTNVEADKQSASDTKQKAAVQIISKETSFVSSPSLGINKLQTMPNGVPVRSHIPEQSTATAKPTTGLKHTIMNAGRSSEVPINANQSSGSVQNESFGIILERNTTKATAEPPDDKLDPSKVLPSENVTQKNHSQQSSTVVLTTSSLGQGTPSNTLSNIFVQQRKVMPESATAETLLMEKNCMQKISNKVSAETPSTSTEINTQPIKEKAPVVQKADLTEMQINNSISTTNKAQQDNFGQTAMPMPPAQNATAEMLPKPSTADNTTFTNATNPKAVLAKDATKDAEMRKKRKRDYQKHRRQFLNSNKEHATPNATAGASPSITGAPASKKRPRKLLKVEEDYDNFNENLMSHIRQMQPLQVLEPILSRNYSACKMYGKARVNKDAAAASGSNDGLIGEFGCAKLTQVDGLYEKDCINSSADEKDDRNKALSIQNDFYDQEFVPIMSGSEQEKTLRLIGTIRERQLEPLEVICNKNSNNFTSTTDSQQLSKLNTFACLSYPGLILRHSGSSQCFGRMSPVIPFVEPCVQSSPNLPLNFLIEEDNKTATDEKPTMNILKIKRESSEEIANSQSVVFTLSPSAVNNVLGVLKDLANLLNIATPTNFKIIDPIDNNTQDDDKTKHKMPSVFKKATLMQILNGRCKICAKCGRTIESDGIRCSKKAFENCIVTTIAMPQSECSIYFCSRACYNNAKNGTDIALPDQQSKTMNANQSNQSRLYPPIKNETTTTIQQQSDKVTKKRRFKYFTSKCFTPKPHIKHPSEKELVDILFKMDVTVSANTVIKSSLSGTPVIRPIEDARQCILCRQQGDGVPDGPSRLLNFDIDKYVHLNCALWSNGVYETISGGLMNLTSAVQASLNQSCSACQQIGATVKCFKNRCGAVFHLPCALKKGCVFYKNKTIHCQQHAVKTEKENELTTLSVYRRVFIERDENRQVAAVMHHSELSNLLRVGSLTFLNVGQLLPHQLEAFHNNNYIYPIGYKITRFYWSMKRPNKRCRYVCSIIDVAGKPEFRIQVQESNESDVELQDTTPSGVWQKVLESIATMRKKHDLVQLFPRHISGEDLFGLTEPAIVRIIESLPGVESLTDYRFKYGRNPLLELPLAINPSGAARTEPKQRQIMGWRKPHTQRTGTFSNHQRVANSVTSAVAGEVTCPYSKQFVHSKSSQYKKMKQEWRNNVYLARSKIQGLGLYAARDMERHTMIIEYIGEVIRTEVSEIREKQYESRNRGIYMFRLDEERVVDATLSGGLARYINHSCNPNCVTEIVEVDRELRIIIFAKRRINRGEELSYDYKFDIEDDANKIQCMCGAPNCRKWMN